MTLVAAETGRRTSPLGRPSPAVWGLLVHLGVAIALAHAAGTAGAVVIHAPAPPAGAEAFPGQGAAPPITGAGPLGGPPPALDAGATFGPAGRDPVLAPGPTGGGEILSGMPAAAAATVFLPPPRTGPAPPAPRPTAVTVRDLLRLYVNRPRTPAASRARAPASFAAPSAAAPESPSQQRRGAGAGSGLVDAVLDMAVGPGLVEALATVLRPSPESNGLVTFTVAGFGRFLLLETNDRQAIRLINAHSGASVTVAGAKGRSGSRVVESSSDADDAGPVPPRPRQPITMREFLLLLLDYLLDPLPIGLGLGLVALWSVWRLRRGGA